MVHDEPHFMQAAGIAQSVVECTACCIIPLLEVYFAFPVQLGGRNAGVEEGELAVDLLLHHQYFADKDGSSRQKGQAAQISFLDEVYG